MCFEILRKDRIVSAKWIRKFEIADIGVDMRTRHHCLQLLLVALQNRTLVGVFKYLPDSGTAATDLRELARLYPADIRQLVQPRASDVCTSLLGRFSLPGGDENGNMLVRSFEQIPNDEHNSDTDDAENASQVHYFYAFDAGQTTGEWMQRDASGRAPCRVYSELTIDETVPSEM